MTDNTILPIIFKLHCIQLLSYKDSKNLSDNPAQALRYFNPPGNSSKEWKSRVSYSADITIIFKKDTGDRSGLSVFHGIRDKQTSIIIGQDFILDRHTFLHELGHMLGCSHEESASITLTHLSYQCNGQNTFIFSRPSIEASNVYSLRTLHVQWILYHYGQPCQPKKILQTNQLLFQS